MAGKTITREHEFDIHRLGCKQCATVVIERPASLVNCCLLGAPLLRDYLNALSEPAARKQINALKRQFTQQDGKNYGATKKKLKEVIKYK